MNRVESLFKTLESPEFAAIVNLASDWKTFARILGSEKSAQDLAGEMSDASVRGAVCARIFALVADHGEEGFEHPWDSALAAYLWLLAAKDEPLARSAAAKIAEAPRCWWARKAAEGVLSTGEDGGVGNRGRSALSRHRAGTEHRNQRRVTDLPRCVHSALAAMLTFSGSTQCLRSAV
jgi:hypothetical protein